MLGRTKAPEQIPEEPQLIHAFKKMIQDYSLVSIKKKMFNQGIKMSDNPI